MPRNCFVAAFASAAVLLISAPAAADPSIVFKPAFLFDPGEETVGSDYAENESFETWSAIDLGLDLTPLSPAPWLVFEGSVGWRPPRDVSLGELTVVHASAGARAQLPGMVQPGVFGRAGVSWAVLEQFDNTGASLQPIFAFGGVVDVQLIPSFHFGVELSWETTTYGSFGARAEWVLLAARLGYDFQ